MTQSGWRKPTPGLGIAEQLAQAGAQVAVPKSEAFVAVKRVGAHIGLKASDLMLLDTLGAFTQLQDWGERRRPIVWASNAYLMEQTGFSLSALKRHARRLAEVGVIAFKNGPNGKRWGRRNDDGHIVEACGFDLSPLAARAEEFTELYGRIQEERALRQRLKRQITVARRMIRARIEAAFQSALRGAWAQYLERFEGLLTRLPRANASSETLEQVLVWFQGLQERVEQAYLKAFRGDECRSAGIRETVQACESLFVRLHSIGVSFKPCPIIPQPTRIGKKPSFAQECLPNCRNSSPMATLPGRCGSWM